MVSEICSVPECDRPATRHVKTICESHYQKQYEATRPPCSFEGCGRPQHGNDEHCKAHYMQMRNAGVLKPIQPWGRRLSPEERFWQKVDKSGSCWEWMAGTNAGYGSMSHEGKPKLAHRHSYELANGSIPEGMQIDHKCHNRLCVNPGHLRVVTNKQNTEHQLGPNRNSSTGIRGVSWSKQTRRWRARVEHNGASRAKFFVNIADAEEAVRLMRNEVFSHNDHDRIAA